MPKLIVFLVILISASAQAAGDAATGKALYAVCAACHGAQGEGNQALNSPKLSGQEEWYLIRHHLIQRPSLANKLRYGRTHLCS